MPERSEGQRLKPESPQFHLEQEKLKEHLDLIDLQALFFDLDGTLLQDKSFKENRRRAGEILVQSIKESERSTALEIFWELDRASLDYYGSEPGRWGLVVEGMVRGWPEIEEEAVRRSWEYLMKAYQDPFPPFPGVVELLSALSSCDRKIAVITLSTEKDAVRKCEEADIYNLIDTLYCVTKSAKTPEHWKDCARTVRAEPTRSLAMGDSLVSDVSSSLAAGYKWVVNYDSKNRRPAQGFTELEKMGVARVCNMQEFYNLLLNIGIHW